MKICHLTTAHPRNDVRIFEKECAALASVGVYAVILLVADGKGVEERDGVFIHDIGLRKGRMNRFFVQSIRMLKFAFKEKAEIYHFHDPELILTGFILRLFGKKVIYDVHEDVPKSLLGREWLPKWILKILAFKFKIIENQFSRTFNGIITATPAITERFRKVNTHTTTIQNFSQRSIANQKEIVFSNRKDICYIGAISKIRGIIPLMDALSYCNPEITLQLAGSFIHASIEEEVKKHPNFSRVQFHGQLKRKELQAIYDQSFAGLVTFLPVPNHMDAQPNKFFEYMGAGLPLIVSDFPFWKDLVEKNEIGYCVNPENPKVIADAINKLYLDKARAKEMGTKGRNLILEKYNWENEKQKLLGFYSKVIR